MRRYGFVLLTLVISLLATDVAQADWHEFWERVKLDTKRNAVWPQPFVSIDRRAARSPFMAMQQKGWQLETTITDFHFDRETNRLTDAGRLKVRWILNEVPPHRRTVFVLRGESSQTTAIRVDSVQRAISQMLPSGPLPPVVQTNVAPRGASATYVHDINTRAESSRSDPVLPEGGDSSSSDSGS